MRDFAFATSRKFIWDAMQIDQAGKKVMCMSLYSKEGNPLWGKSDRSGSSHHTFLLEVFGRLSLSGGLFVPCQVGVEWNTR